MMSPKTKKRSVRWMMAAVAVQAWIPTVGASGQTMEARTARGNLVVCGNAHTLLVTEDGVEAFTGRLPTSNPFFWDAEGYTPPDAVAVAAAKPKKTPPAPAAAVAAGGSTRGFSSAAAPAKSKKKKPKKKR